MLFCCTFAAWSGKIKFVACGTQCMCSVAHSQQFCLIFSTDLQTEWIKFAEKLHEKLLCEKVVKRFKFNLGRFFPFTLHLFFLFVCLNPRILPADFKIETVSIQM